MRLWTIVLIGSLAGVCAAGDVDVWLSTEDMENKLSRKASLKPADAGRKSSVDKRIEIDPDKTRQTILGLGASLEHTTCYNLHQLGPEKMDETIERLVDPDSGIGMNLMRICIGTPDFTGEDWYSYDDMPPGENDPELERFSIDKDRAYVLPVLKKALEKNPDLRFFASPWSPPGWMTSTDDMIGGHLEPRYYDEYAEYFVKFIKAYEDEGIPIYAVTPQNEPGVNTRNYPMRDWYPSCQWSLIEDEDNFWPVVHEVMGHNERDFIKNHLGPAFEKHDVSTRIWCYDHNLNNLWYPREILSDPEAAEYVDGTAFHAYAGRLDAMTEFHNEFPDKPIYFTEGSCPGTRGAMKIVGILRNRACCYNSWVIMIDYDGKPNRGPFTTTRTGIQPRRDGSGVDYHFTYYSYGQFMKFIRRGAVRIDSTEGGRGFNNVAFRNPDGTLVMVVVNREWEPVTFEAVCRGKSFTSTLPEKAVATYVWSE